MLRVSLIAVGLAGLLVGCGGVDPPDAATTARAAPSRAGEPLDAVDVAARIAKVRAASIAGDEATVRREMEGFQDDVRRSMKMADPGRPIDPEQARAAAKRVAGVHSAVWIDRQNFLALVDRNGQRTMATIDAICSEIEPLGDTLAVVVHLQSRAARTGDELETISRNCQLAEGDHAFAQRHRELDVIPRELRAQHASQQALGDNQAATRRRADEAARLIEATTPEM
jgi:hypothetical protein